LERPKEVYGVDFSGAADAGMRVWIAEGLNDGGTLTIRRCIRGDELEGSGKERKKCLGALAGFVKAHPCSAFGFDFPFGVPGVLVRQRNWQTFVSVFSSLYKDPDYFREACFKKAGGRELKRATDKLARTPFSSYNRRVYKQTYFGITEILQPLVQNDSARVLPMQKPFHGKPWVMEICPASNLKAFGLYSIHYKGKGKQHREGRQKIVESFSKAFPFQLTDHDVERRVVENPGGDALDSIIAAAGTFQALRRKDLFAPRYCNTWNVEGYVYA
jgi:hypothetical protein